MSLTGRHFLKELDFTTAEWTDLLLSAQNLKQHKRSGSERQRLQRKSIALIFEKTSTRTRCAFEVASFDQGAHVTYLDPSGSQIGHKESVADTAQVLGRMYDGIEYRGTSQSIVEELAAYAGVPVFNGLTDEWHPTQSLADQLTMMENTDKPLTDVASAFVGDARFNMGNSALVSGAMMGMDIRIVAPPALQPAAEVVAEAQRIAATTGARVTITDDPGAVAGVDFVHTDVWVSMGEPKDVWRERIEMLLPYQVNASLMRTAGPRARFMHCLPAYHDRATKIGEEIFQGFGLDGVEVTDEAFSSPASLVFDQAENRLHTIKAVLVASLS